MKKIEITLTDAQAIAIENAASALRSNKEAIAKAYLLEGFRMLTEDSPNSREEIITSGIQILGTYVDDDETPDSVFAPICPPVSGDTPEERFNDFMGQGSCSAIAKEVIAALETWERDYFMRDAEESGNSLEKHIFHILMQHCKARQEEVLAVH